MKAEEEDLGKSLGKDYKVISKITTIFTEHFSTSIREIPQHIQQILDHFLVSHPTAL